MLRDYIKNIHRDYNNQSATEQSHYPTLKKLLEEYAKSSNKKDITVTSDPKRTKIGKPDFKINEGQKVVGYIEAKSLNTNLDSVVSTEQLGRYLTSPNVILTNFLEFRLYRKGKQIAKTEIASYNQLSHFAPPLKENPIRKSSLIY